MGEIENSTHWFLYGFCAGIVVFILIIVIICVFADKEKVEVSKKEPVNLNAGIEKDAKKEIITEWLEGDKLSIGGKYSFFNFTTNSIVYIVEFNCEHSSSTFEIKLTNFINEYYNISHRNRVETERLAKAKELYDQTINDLKNGNKRI